MPDQPSLPALPVTFRPGRTRAVLLSAAGAIFVVITVVALLLPTLGPGERLSFVFTAAMLAGVLCLLSRPKVVADDSGVTVVNITARRQLGWAEIVQVNLRVGDPWVFLDLTDGTSLPALGIQPGIAKQHAIEDARTLRALVEAHSVAGPEPHQG
ncbi:PH domain-containing protein [Streptomyces caniscabiei]|uniref:PH domain-containing protein n=1 Tax=Streptomyces caniscabiei TaxID=2746961 RepID=UPI0029B3839F|nr:PH domain-containing protein [Streptomyces caniscabiei]MDX2603553.1 PH domain-containing protein [Streptomyces caniscabiei]MDX2740629.1 PH domain-containing protein [Streptomyces caniscabiei]MDX2780643.1 PH domain-containing protein [Streptomyces caniscabiei]